MKRKHVILCVHDSSDYREQAAANEAPTLVANTLSLALPGTPLAVRRVFFGRLDVGGSDLSDYPCRCGAVRCRGTMAAAEMA